MIPWMSPGTLGSHPAAVNSAIAGAVFPTYLSPMHHPLPMLTPLPDFLPEGLGAFVTPEALRHPRLMAWNMQLAAELGLPEWSEVRRSALFTGSELFPGSRPFSTVYAGHQFGHWVPQLGDGRALSLGRLPDGTELQLKGSGQTPYSRFADGKAVWRSSIREYLASEAMHALGIPTTRALALVAGDDPVQRETWERAAVLTRTAPSFVRFGHIEFLSHHGRHEELAALVDAIVAQHFPDWTDDPDRARLFYRETVRRTARLIAQWMAVGFCHGVMNTDNMSILGLTIDYGPYGFLEAYDPHYICNHSDTTGRYAYAEQPRVAQWNLMQLGVAMLPLMPKDQLEEALNAFPDDFTQTYTALMRTKLGLAAREPEDGALLQGWLHLLHKTRADYTRAFRALNSFSPAIGNDRLDTMFGDEPLWNEWRVRYGTRLIRESSDDATRQDAMNAINPAVILRNYMAQEVIDAAEKQDDFTAIENLRALLADPFSRAAETHPYAAASPAWAGDICVSCSS